MQTSCGDIMSALAAQRPLFHSEADFQHAFAWEVQHCMPNAEVRLEYPWRQSDKSWYIDLWIRAPSDNIAVELKYKPQELAVTVNGESYGLKHHSAEDLARYDFVRDIRRLEKLVAAHDNTVGWGCFSQTIASTGTPLLQGIPSIRTSASARVES